MGSRPPVGGLRDPAIPCPGDHGAAMAMSGSRGGFGAAMAMSGSRGGYGAAMAMSGSRGDIGVAVGREALTTKPRQSFNNPGDFFVVHEIDSFPRHRPCVSAYASESVTFPRRIACSYARTHVRTHANRHLARTHVRIRSKPRTFARMHAGHSVS